MKTFAPELSALIIILRSTGPVISTRRSCRSAGAGATVKSSGARTNRGPGPASRRAPEQPLALGIQLTMQLVDERERVAREDVVGHERWSIAGFGVPLWILVARQPRISLPNPSYGSEIRDEKADEHAHQDHARSTATR